MKKLTNALQIIFLGGLVAGFGSCVDHDYDLTEDIDLTIEIGSGELNVPGSNTRDITLENILDIDYSASSVKKAEYDGQYGLKKGDLVLVQEAPRTSSLFKVNSVIINSLQGSRTTTSIPAFYNPGGISGKITQEVPESSTRFKIEDQNVTKELVSLSKIELDLTTYFELGFISNDYTGEAFIEDGFMATFDPSWTISLTGETANEYLTLVNSHTLKFKKSYAVTSSRPFSAMVRIESIDCSKLPAGQGLVSLGHILFDNKIFFSGKMSILAENLAAGKSVNLSLIANTSFPNSAVFKTITGKVNPKINIEDTRFTISDIPDFLNDEKNRLSIENPHILFRVDNTSPVDIELNAVLTPYIEGMAQNASEVGIGCKYGTQPVIIPANANSYEIIISRKPMNGANANVVVPNLDKVIEAIPDEILLHDVDCKAIQKDVTITLGANYVFNSYYQAIIPFAFSENMLLNYTHEEIDWDSDLRKYNIKHAEIRLHAISTLPLDMAPTIIPLDRDNQPFTTLETTVTMADGSSTAVISAGTPKKPTTSDLIITLKSTGKNIEGLDGLKLVFKGSTRPEFAGTNLNADQIVRFEKITIKIIGGFTIDLND